MRPFFFHWNANIHTYSYNSKNQKPEFHKFHDFFYFESRLRASGRLRNLKNSVKTSGHYLSILNWSLNNIIYNIQWPLSLAQSALKAKKSWNFWNSGVWFFKLWQYMWFDRCSSFNLWQKNGRPTYPKLPTTFYDVSVLCNLFSKTEMRQFGASGNQRIWDCQEPTG